ncbi:MAG: Mur ligase family protein [Deinococcota bacterium]|nr:Mur ligase family protein [Deinococcota bacterium]
MTILPTTYAQALDWLFAQTRGGAARDPKRMRRLVTQLGLGLPPAFYVVGTTGKGTVASMIHAALGAANVRSGLFVSPHVEDFRERISVGGESISEEAVVEFTGRVAALGLGAAFFELSLAMALEHFAREGVEVAVVEAGVGARNDATNILDKVLCTVLTNVGEDHLDTLGPGLSDVARDKAEAVRPFVPVVTGARGEALDIVRQVAAGRRSPLHAEGDSPLFARPPGLQGADPIRRANARLAAAALRASGLGLGEEALAEGLRTPPLPGRAERFFIGGKGVLLDGAHNPPAARALAAMLETPFVLVFGALSRKAGEATLQELEPYALTTFITQADDRPSTLRAGARRVFIADPLQALQAALEAAPPCQVVVGQVVVGQVVVAGSLYLAGRLRPHLRRQSLSEVA